MRGRFRADTATATTLRKGAIPDRGLDTRINKLLAAVIGVVVLLALCVGTSLPPGRLRPGVAGFSAL